MAASDHTEPTGNVEPDDDYVSPGPARLERSGRRESPVRRILAAPSEPASPAPSAAASAELDARLDRLERRQVALADNLTQAHRAFAAQARRVAELAELAGALQAGLAERERLGARVAALERRLAAPGRGTAAGPPGGEDPRAWWRCSRRRRPKGH